MVERRPRTAKTHEELLRILPGYKAPVSKPVLDEEGNPIMKEEAASMKIPLLPDFGTKFEMITKDGLDAYR